ncbi:MAG: AAA family ATPase [Chloroflexota bacterium]|nr:AAA family ATPase [Chloroflexota bacterium]
MASAPDRSRVPLLVGRERELAVLRDRLDAALDRHGGLTLIGGAAGIGKTALARTIGEEASLQNVCVLTGRCYDLAETPPYGPWREILGDAPSMPGLSLPAPFTADAPAADMLNQMMLFARVRDFLIALAAHRPLLLVLEDVHWVDPASLDLLRFLSHSMHAAPLLILSTYRGDELDRAHPLYQIFPALVREADATRVDLAPLTSDDICSLVHARYALADEDARRLAAYLTVRSEGNALFCVELLRTLEEEGFLYLRDGDWMLHDLTRARVPLLLRQVIDARLARLGAEADHLLAVAAIIGPEAPLDLWAAVSDTEENVLLDLAERAVAAHVLDETADGNAVRFAHALIRDSLYEGMLASRRRLWHRRIAEAIAATPHPDPHAVAHHFNQADDARAVEWLVKTGEEAQRTYAWVTAAQRYEEALALIPDSDANSHARGWLQFSLGRMRRGRSVCRSTPSPPSPAPMPSPRDLPRRDPPRLPFPPTSPRAKSKSSASWRKG